MLICFYFLYYNDERDEGQTLWFALVWKILPRESVVTEHFMFLTASGTIN